MKKIIILLGLLFLSCKQQPKDIFSLKYIKSDNEITLYFENNTKEDIIFLTPNTLEFGDKNFKSLTSEDGIIKVYALLKPDQSSKFYQNKLDSIWKGYLIETGFKDFINDIRPGDGNSVLYLKKMGKLSIRYDLIIKQSAPLNKYSSKFKQNYYPYDKVLKGDFHDSEYLRRFSKLNFGKAKFVVQPVIEDSLFLNISDKDANK
ncbi:hypothetical protein [Chryseobacterium indologenes]|uniref:Uncharacterized protein n=1 Tax=Chryseobacterium indologenes TaxID=253 RepID=A0A0N0IV04_CHRID|nr:hypothetical protein [Chryseobacterium indologenes]KPE50101.1 hypothetical protein AOB46_16820 [Chryseobacterium indologenes]